MRILAPISNSPTVQVPAAPPAPATPQVGDDATAALQSQVREISRQLSQLSRERQIIGQRLERASGAEASALRMQADALNSEIGNLTGALSESASRLAELKIQQAISNMPPPAFPPMGRGSQPWVDPDAITFVFVLFSIGVIVPLSIALMRRLWRRPPQAPGAPHDGEIIPSARLERLEQAVDAIAIEVERISEGQRFITKVLSERTLAVGPNQGRDANDPAGLGDATPFLALGAGPIEPIRSTERQTVRASVTPH